MATKTPAAKAVPKQPEALVNPVPETPQVPDLAPAVVSPSPDNDPPQPDTAAVQDNVSADQTEEAPVPEAPPVPTTAVESLSDYIARVERAHLDRDVVAVAVTHPDAKIDFYQGTYSGIRLTVGDTPSVRYSDGTTE